MPSVFEFKKSSKKLANAFSIRISKIFNKTCKCLLVYHICLESNLGHFEIPEDLNTFLGSSKPPYVKTCLGFVLTKNVPFSKISVKI